jgi:CRISPR-associated protein Cmr3
MSRAATTTTRGTERIGLCVEPLDVLFFRDGRPFTPASRNRSELPMPQTLAGALYTAFLEQAGCNFAELGRRMRAGESFREVVSSLCGLPWLAEMRIRGPWLAKVDANGNPDVLVPPPATLVEEKGRKPWDQEPRRHLLRPLSRTSPLASLGAAEPGMRLLWLKQREPTEPVAGYLTRGGLERFLAGHVPQQCELVKADELFDHDHRTGIVIEPDRLTAQEGQIYATSFLALQPGVWLYAELGVSDAPADLLAGITTLALGGEGRRVRVRALAGKAFTWPEATPQEPGQRPFLFLTTPGIFRAGWKPDCLERRMVAAAVPGSVAVSGWDLARGGPKPTRFAAAAGSVYFLDSFPDDLPDALSDRDEDRRQGWGCYTRGVWTDE